MDVTYAEACRRIAAVATQQRESHLRSREAVAVDEAVGRTVRNNVFSPVSTPACDTSAMDGFAVCSALTTSASLQTPLRLRVVGTIIAGRPSRQFDADIVDGLVPCVEIMTGATFPLVKSGNPQYDACIPYEKTSKLLQTPSLTSKVAELIQIEQPAQPNQHRRIAGCDYSIGDTIVEGGTVLNPQHIMAAASVGITSFDCYQRLRVGVLSTGSELVRGSDCLRPLDTSKIPDVNGPYLLAAIRDLDHEAQFLGTIGDVLTETSERIREAIASGSFDIIVSTGGVSAGKMDCVPEALKTLRAAIHFHHVAMRPGHPALFATLAVPSQRGDNLPDALAEDARTRVTFFGLPGNPIAAAACFRFLVTPYCNYLLGAAPPQCNTATLQRTLTEPSNENHNQDLRGCVLSNPRWLDQFRHGHATIANRELLVQFSAQQSPARISPFAAANCWIHVPRDKAEVFPGDRLPVYFLSKYAPFALQEDNEIVSLQLERSI